MSTRLKRIMSLAAMMALLYVAGLKIQPIQQMRIDYDLTSEPVKEVTPQMALATQVLGWGRGLIIDVIWIRMETLKMEDRYFELVQLADWACKLAPRFPRVWDFQSWNLAYNVSCRVSHLPERWPWIWSAIELLRDQGIKENPYSPLLYDRLATLFYHKIGEQNDNAHFFYKQQLGLMMHEILGGEGSKEALEALAGAPRTKEEVLLDPDVKRLYDECMAGGFDVIHGYFELYKMTASVPEGIYEIASAPYNLEGLRKVMAFVRAKRLREELQMDVNLMLELREKYGPFDWRSPYPHAVYWATVGIQKLDELEKRTIDKFAAFNKDVPTPYDEDEEYFRGGEGLYEFNRVQLERIIYASMQSLVLRGRVMFDTRGLMQLEVGPDYRFADATLPLYQELIEGHDNRFAEGAKTGRMNFLRRGLIEFYYMGDSQRSHKYFQMLKEEYPDEVRKRTYDTYRRFVINYSLQDMTTAEARRLVVSYMRRSLVSLGCADYNEAAILEQQARDFAEQWNTSENTDGTLRTQVRFDKLRESAIVDVLTGRGGILFSRPVLLGLVRELRKQRSDIVERIIDNVTQQGLPIPEEVKEELMNKKY